MVYPLHLSVVGNVRGGRLPSQNKTAEQNNKRTNTKVKT